MTETHCFEAFFLFLVDVALGMTLSRRVDGEELEGMKMSYCDSSAVMWKNIMCVAQAPKENRRRPKTRRKVIPLIFSDAYL